LRSLFVVSLPRSLSTRVYDLARRSLGLREPVWTSDGEVLNIDRFALLADEVPFDALKFTHPKRRPQRFARLLAFAEQVTRPEGFAYKDVVQPFVMAEWLPGSGLAVLKIERPVADVAWAMVEQGWLYPARLSAAGAGPGGDGARPPERALIEGLVKAEIALSELPGATVRFDDLVRGPDALRVALAALYDGAAAPVPDYLDDAFENVRDEVLKRRETDRYREIEALYREVLTT
jgi:hypothetical protein